MRERKVMKLTVRSERAKLNAHIARTDQAIKRQLNRVVVPTLDEHSDFAAETEIFISRLTAAIASTEPRVRQGIVASAALGVEATTKLVEEQWRR
mgnify:CR=1 FL=1